MAYKSLFPQSCVSSGGSMVGLMATSSNKGLMPYPGLLHPEPLPLHQATTEPCLHRRHSNTVLAQSLWVSGSWCTQGIFEPSEHLWQVWSLILNVISLLLPSCWGFSFALVCGTSPQSCSSTTQPLLQCLPSCWGFSALGCGVSPHSCSSTTQPPLQC